MMNKLARFENFEYNIEPIFEEWRLPTYQDTIKRKLSFLKKIDLSELEPTATHQLEIKELWRKIIKKLYTNDKAAQYIGLVDNYDVHHLNDTFEVIKKMKDSLISKEDVGYILYHPEMDKFFYEKPIDHP